MLDSLRTLWNRGASRVCRRIGEFIRRQRRWPYHDTAAIQATIKAAAAAGGGSVLFKLARYYTAGTLQVPGGVVLCGIDPATTAVAPTLLVTNTSAPFITLTGIGSGVTDMLFHYPNQVKTGASTGASAPTAYPLYHPNPFRSRRESGPLYGDQCVQLPGYRTRTNDGCRPDDRGI